jgi:hypothetical protein
MNKAERITDRLPRFYKAWDKDSLMFSLISACSSQLDQAEGEVVSLMRAHWVDSAQGTDLDRLGAIVGSKRMSAEGDGRYRARLKRAVTEYEGGGTVPAILEAVRSLIGAMDPADVKIIENPPTPMSADFRVTAGATWKASSQSVAEAMPTITLMVEEGGEVSDPIISNLDTTESLKYSGIMKSGQKLVLSPDGAELDGKGVKSKISKEGGFRLLRTGSTWKYSESLSAMLGVFDSSKFDEHTFTTGIPFVTIRFEWTSLLPAAFEVQIRSKALQRSRITVKDIESFVASMKASGVKSTVRII